MKNRIISDFEGSNRNTGSWSNIREIYKYKPV